MILLKRTVMYLEALDLSLDALTEQDLRFSLGRGLSVFYV